MSRRGEDLKIESEDGGGEWRPLREFSKSLSTEQTFNARQCRNKLFYASHAIVSLDFSPIMP